MVVYFIYLICYSLQIIDIACAVPEVKTPLGGIKGTMKRSFGGRKYAAFEGIPYAQPPTRERRFEV